MNEFSTCPHFGFCSGCNVKEMQLGCIEKFLETSIPLERDSKIGWRMRAKLAVRGTAKKPLIGLYKMRSHEVLSIPHCLAHHPAINEAAKCIFKEMRRQNHEPYSEISQTGGLRYVQFFVSRLTGLIQLALVAKDHASVVSLAKALFEKTTLFHSIWINVQPSSGNAIFGTAWSHLYGELFLEQPIGKATIFFHPGAFAQAHLTLFDRLLEKVASWVVPQTKFLEVYAGAGGITLHLLDKLSSAVLVEENPYAYQSFQRSCKSKHVQYVQGVATRAIEYLDWADTILVDPPRKGVDLVLLDAIKILQGRCLIYISCNFESFARDVLILRENGWFLEEAVTYELFPGTDHLELATVWHKSR